MDEESTEQEKPREASNTPIFMDDARSVIPKSFTIRRNLPRPLFVIAGIALCWFAVSVVNNFTYLFKDEILFAKRPTAAVPNRSATQQVLHTTSTARAIQTDISDTESRWNLLLSDTYDTNENRWEIDYESNARLAINRRIARGKYIWDVTSKNGFIYWVTANTEVVDDFSLTAEMEQTEGPRSTDYGLIFRKDSGNNFYYFSIEGLRFEVYMRRNDEWVKLVQSTVSTAILPAAPNRLTVLAQGSHFIFLINDQYVAAMTDDHIPRGTTGLAIHALEPNLRVSFEFDNFELRTP